MRRGGLCLIGVLLMAGCGTAATSSPPASRGDAAAVRAELARFAQIGSPAAVCPLLTSRNRRDTATRAHASTCATALSDTRYLRVKRYAISRLVVVGAAGFATARITLVRHDGATTFPPHVFDVRLERETDGWRIAGLTER